MKSHLQSYPCPLQINRYFSSNPLKEVSKALDEHRTAHLITNKSGKERIIISNKKNVAAHAMERAMARTFGLIILFLLSHIVNHELQDLIVTFVRLIGQTISHYTSGLEINTGYEVLMVIINEFHHNSKDLFFSIKDALSWIVGSAQFFGFVPFHSCGSCLHELRSLATSSTTLFETDLRAAFEACDLGILESQGVGHYKKYTDYPETIAQALKVLISFKKSLFFVNVVKFGNTILASKAFLKQFPDLSSFIEAGGTLTFEFRSSQLIQGSALSPLLFNLWLGMMLRRIEQRLVIYGDNIYSLHPLPVIKGVLVTTKIHDPRTLRTLGASVTVLKNVMGGEDYILVSSADVGYSQHIADKIGEDAIVIKR